MSAPRKLLIIGGLGLAVWGMSFGLWYALFDEHQTLEQMGVSLATGFVRAAERNLPAAHAAIDQYAAAKFEYVREVDVHSHWIGLAMLLIILGVVFDRVALDDRLRMYVAAALVVGSAIFPFGVILQTVIAGPAAEALAAVGAVMVTAALAAVALGFARGNPPV